MASAYNVGNGVKQDFVKSFEYTKKAADLGHVGCMYYTAKCYEEGKGTDPNEKEAVRYHKMAAENGHKYSKLLIECDPERFK